MPISEGQIANGARAVAYRLRDIHELRISAQRPDGRATRLSIASASAGDTTSTRMLVEWGPPEEPVRAASRTGEPRTGKARPEAEGIEVEVTITRSAMTIHLKG